jgi:hypothetical protein
MSALANQIHDNPVILPSLQMSDIQFSGLPAPQTAAQENAEKGSISFTL